MAGLRFFKALKTMNKIGHTRLSSSNLTLRLGAASRTDNRRAFGLNPRLGAVARSKLQLHL
jgi:hypothetical protein